MNPNTKKRFPPVCTAILIFAALSGVLYVIFRVNPPFADWFNENVSTWGRRALAYVTAALPFSVAEFLLCSIPVLLVILVVIAYRHYCDSWQNAFVYVGKLLTVAAVIAIMFIWNFAPGYFGSTLDQKLDLKREKVSAQQLSQTAEILITELNALSEEIIFLADGTSLMPYSYGQMNDKLLDAYEKFCQKHDFLDHFHSRVKPVMLSEPMSYTHITGVYTFFTGEANINVNFPDYTIPFTAAHELAHQRGIAREDEANFVAFLVCMESDDAYIRYSGALNLYEYVASALDSADKKLYKENYLKQPKTIIAERIAYSKFFEKYRENTAAKVSEATNNAYLQSQGTPQGTRSYGMVVDLAVAYYRGK